VAPGQRPLPLRSKEIGCAVASQRVVVRSEVGIAVEVGHTTDYPGIDALHGEAKCGATIIGRGPNIGAALRPAIAAAEKAKVPYQIGAEPRGTGTDANAIQLSRGGKAAGLISIPLRYMHTPTEVLALSDLDAAVKLLTRFVLDLKPGRLQLPALVPRPLLRVRTPPDSEPAHKVVDCVGDASASSVEMPRLTSRMPR
jgi:putative aminopeptidase FrvX